MPIIGSPATADDEPDDDPMSFEVPTAPLEMPGGDGAPGRTGRTNPVPNPVDFPEINTSRFERPERNTDRRQTLALMQLAGAAGSLFGAAGDNNMLTAIGAGISSAGRRGVQTIDEQFRQKQKAYQQFLQDAREFNRQSRLAEAEATARRRRNRRERQFERSQNEAQRQLRRDLNEPSGIERQIQEFERDLTEAQVKTEKEQAETEEARQASIRAETDQTRAGGQPQSSFDDLPDDPRQLRSLQTQLEAQADALRSEMPTGMRGFGPNREPTQPVLRRQLSERIATKRAQIAAIEAKLSELEAGQGGRGGGQGTSQNAGNAGPVTTQPSVFNQGAAAAPGGATRQTGTQTGQQTNQQSGRQDADQDRGQQRQLSEAQVRGLIQAAPDTTTASAEELRVAAERVLSDTTDSTPADFEAAYGFNPFTTDSVATQR
jgi:hypothetical protein